MPYGQRSHQTGSQPFLIHEVQLIYYNILLHLLLMFYGSMDNSEQALLGTLHPPAFFPVHSRRCQPDRVPFWKTAYQRYQSYTELEALPSPVQMRSCCQ